MPVKHRSMLRSIQHGLLSNAGTVKDYGYEKIMQPLVKDLVHLEQIGLFIDQLGLSCIYVLITLVLILWQDSLRVLLWRDSAIFAWEQELRFSTHR